VDRTSRAARIQAGALGPELEAQLKPHGLTLRHFPQSFEFSTLGGWIATRAGGHYAMQHTHIDDFVENTRLVTPAGVMQTRRLPGSGAGPAPDRLVLGSEGTLGVITEAWVRLQDAPRFRASASVRLTTTPRAWPACARSRSRA
jgi:alkyldihydroxyacetonephosphate synthase